MNLEREQICRSCVREASGTPLLKDDPNIKLSFFVCTSCKQREKGSTLEILRGNFPEIPQEELQRLHFSALRSFKRQIDGHAEETKRLHLVVLNSFRRQIDSNPEDASMAPPLKKPIKGLLVEALQKCNPPKKRKR